MDSPMDLVLVQELLSSSSSSSLSSSPKSTSTSSSSSSTLSLEKTYSETFSDDDFFELYQLLEKIERKAVKNFVEDVVDNYTDEEFRKLFRVPRVVANTLCEQFNESKFYKRSTQGGGRKAIPAKSQALSFLWFAVNKNTYREVARLFNLSLSSAYRHQTSFLEFLFDIAKDHVKMPSTNAEKEEKSAKFQRVAGMPDVIGSIGGCDIFIRNPARKHSSLYKTAEGRRSITLQAICDADTRFMDVFAGSSSKLHSSEIYQISEVSKCLPNICERKYHILGSAAYPLREYLLTPYLDDGTLSAQQYNFNQAHSQTNEPILNAFRHLKQRFRQLNHLDFFTVSRMSKFVLGCCIIHNMCIESGDLWIEDDDEVEADNDKDKENDNNSKKTDVKMEVEYAPIDNAEDTILIHQGLVKREVVTAAL